MLHPNLHPLMRYEGDRLTSTPIVEPYMRADPFLPPSKAMLDIDSKAFRINCPEGPSTEFAFRWQTQRQKREMAPS